MKTLTGVVALILAGILCEHFKLRPAYSCFVGSLAILTSMLIDKLFKL